VVERTAQSLGETRATAAQTAMQYLGWRWRIQGHALTWVTVAAGSPSCRERAAGAWPSNGEVTFGSKRLQKVKLPHTTK